MSNTDMGPRYVGKYGTVRRKAVARFVYEASGYLPDAKDVVVSTKGFVFPVAKTDSRRIADALLAAPKVAEVHYSSFDGLLTVRWER